MEQGKMLAKIKELGYKVEFGRYEYWEDIPYVEHNDGSRTFLAKTYYAYGSLGIATDVPFTKAKKAIRMKEKNINAIEDIEIRMEANVVTDFYDIIIGVKEASELWDLSLDHVKKLCKDGDIVAKKVGETWVVLKDQGNPKVYKKEMNKMENIKIIIAGIEAGEIELDQEPNLHEIEYAREANAILITHFVESHEELEVFFAEREEFVEIRQRIYDGEASASAFDELVNNEYGDQFDYDKVVAYRIGTGEINWI